MKKLFKKRDKNIAVIQNGDDRSCGGVRRVYDSNAPKVIQSTDISHFQLEFSLICTRYDDVDEDFKGYFTFECDKIDGKVTCKYFKSKRADGILKATFEADDNFLKALDDIVKAEDLARFNGYTYHVAGLPDNFGNYLLIDYVSGERLYTSNNQSIDLPRSALIRIKALFDERWSAISANEKPIEPAPIEWMCECGTANRATTEYCYNCGMPRPGVDPNAKTDLGFPLLGEDKKITD